MIYKFVELSKGEMEGTVYNNVILSDGLRSAKCKNKTNKDDFLTTLPEGTEVKVKLEPIIVKGPNSTTRWDVSLVEIEKLK